MFTTVVVALVAVKAAVKMVSLLQLREGYLLPTRTAEKVTLFNRLQNGDSINICDIVRWGSNYNEFFFASFFDDLPVH